MMLSLIDVSQTTYLISHWNAAAKCRLTYIEKWTKDPDFTDD